MQIENYLMFDGKWRETPNEHFAQKAYICTKHRTLSTVKISQPNSCNIIFTKISQNDVLEGKYDNGFVYL